MSRLPSKEIYVVPDWMRNYLPLFNNTGGNDVEALLHDDSTTPFANVVRYMLIVSVRSQFDLLVMLRKSWLEALETLDEVSLTEVYRSAYEEARQDGLVNWEAATSLAEENEELKRKLEATEKRIAELDARKFKVEMPESFYPDGDIEAPLAVDELEVIAAIVEAGGKPVAFCKRCDCEIDLTHRPDGSHYCHAGIGIKES